jgi:membrane associated rhomboid family serine protease
LLLLLLVLFAPNLPRSNNTGNTYFFVDDEKSVKRGKSCLSLSSVPNTIRYLHQQQQYSTTANTLQRQQAATMKWQSRGPTIIRGDDNVSPARVVAAAANDDDDDDDDDHVNVPNSNNDSGSSRRSVLHSRRSQTSSSATSPHTTAATAAATAAASRRVISGPPVSSSMPTSSSPAVVASWEVEPVAVVAESMNKFEASSKSVASSQSQSQSQRQSKSKQNSKSKSNHSLLTTSPPLVQNTPRKREDRYPGGVSVGSLKSNNNNNPTRGTTAGSFGGGGRHDTRTTGSSSSRASVGGGGSTRGNMAYSPPRLTPAAAAQQQQQAAAAAAAQLRGVRDSQDDDNRHANAASPIYVVDDDEEEEEDYYYYDDDEEQQQEDDSQSSRHQSSSQPDDDDDAILNRRSATDTRSSWDTNNRWGVRGVPVRCQKQKVALQRKNNNNNIMASSSSSRVEPAAVYHLEHFPIHDKTINPTRNSSSNATRDVKKRRPTPRHRINNHHNSYNSNNNNNDNMSTASKSTWYQKRLPLVMSVSSNEDENDSGGGGEDDDDDDDDDDDSETRRGGMRSLATSTSYGDDATLERGGSGGGPLEGVFSEDDYLKTKQSMAVLSIALTCLQLLILCLQLAMCGIASLDINPFVGPFPDAFVEWGGKNAYLMTVQQQWWRLVSPSVLHVGILHLLANAFCQLEPIALFEREWGSFRWLVLYVISSVACNSVSSVYDPDTIAVGSSGALMGLFAAKLAQVMSHTMFEVNKANQDDVIRLDQLSSVIIGLILVSLLSFFTYIDWSGHMGGLAAGFFSGMVLFCNPIKSCCIKIVWSLLGVAGLMAGFGYVFYTLLTVTDPDEELGDACAYFRSLFPEGYECGCLWQS